MTKRLKKQSQQRPKQPDSRLMDREDNCRVIARIKRHVLNIHINSLYTLECEQ